MRNKIHFDHLCRTSYPEGQSGNPDDEDQSNVMEANAEENEMTLPSGANVGHRWARQTLSPLYIVLTTKNLNYQRSQHQSPQSCCKIRLDSRKLLERLFKSLPEVTL